MIEIEWLVHKDLNYLKFQDLKPANLFIDNDEIMFGDYDTYNFKKLIEQKHSTEKYEPKKFNSEEKRKSYLYFLRYE